MKEEHKNLLKRIFLGLIRLGIIIIIIIRSFFEALTIGFYRNIQKYYKKHFKENKETENQVQSKTKNLRLVKNKREDNEKVSEPLP